MGSATIKNLEKYCAKWFWTIVLIQATLWIIVPTWVRYALPHDTIEAVLWGQHLEWGYDKNPWLVAWLARLGALGGSSGWAIYALSEIFVIISLWSVWRLGRAIFPPVYALLGTLLLTILAYYTVTPPSFNDNLIELGLWPLMLWFFYQAIITQRLGNWLGVGIVASLAMMAKYYTALPLLGMLLFLLFNPIARKSFSRWPMYAGLIIFLIILVPHSIWLVQHQFITLNYAVDRTVTSTNEWYQRFYHPLSFAYAQFVNFLPAIVVLLTLRLFNSNAATLAASPVTIDKFNRQFLLFNGLSALLLTLLLSLIGNWYLYNEWGMPLVSLWGLILLLYIQPKISEKSLKIVVRLFLLFALLWPAGYATQIFISKIHHSDDYPAQQIANYANQVWQQRFHKPLKYIAGSRYVAGYIAFYSPDQPAVLVEWNPDYSPWIDLSAMRRYGALFVQDGYYGTLVFGNHPDTHDGTQFPAAVLKQYPTLQVLPIKEFTWQHGAQPTQKIKLLIGILPPETNQ